MGRSRFAPSTPRRPSAGGAAGGLQPVTPLSIRPCGPVHQIRTDLLLLILVVQVIAISGLLVDPFYHRRAVLSNLARTRRLT
jgi:hypothetical protein